MTPTLSIDPRLVTLAIEELPMVIAFFRVLFHKNHPDDPIVTDEDVQRALSVAVASSVAVDDQWLAAHPKP